jgi:hypothetical protein
MERALIGTIVFFLLREFFAELGPWYLIPAGREANLARRPTFKRRCRPWVG